MKKIMIFVAATILFGGCGVYNKYERPEVDTKGLIRDAVSDVDTLVVAPQDTASFGNLPWRSIFTDPLLQTLIEQGLQKNANLQNAALTADSQILHVPNDSFMDLGSLRQYLVTEAFYPDEVTWF